MNLPGQKSLAIVGAGMGGLSLALALTRAGGSCVVFEQAAELTEVGAGIQMGPHVMRRLQAWGLSAALMPLIARPARLIARDVEQGDALAVMPLDTRFERRYGAAYATIHRADLQSVLLHAVHAGGQVDLRLNGAVTAFLDSETEVSLLPQPGASGLGSPTWTGDALVGADGLWSQVRQHLLAGANPQPTGHLAYRAMVPQVLLPERLRSHDVTVWMGPHLHLVMYPVRAGEWLNLVLLVQAQGLQGLVGPGWDQARAPHEIATDLQHALRGSCSTLRDLVGLIDHWRLWPLYARPRVAGPHQMARGRVALLGDAAHPMLPYLAQGAAMAIEDAECLARHWTSTVPEPARRLQAYAQERWQRNARVQERSRRNGVVFHATGPMRWGRNLGLRLLGPALLDQPWLFAG
jgi:salicylate hydroxylase